MHDEIWDSDMLPKHRLALGLFLLTLACFAHVCLCEFVGWDDQIFVTENPHVLGGLSGANIVWAFATQSAGWVPLTWLSLQLDATLFGPEVAWGFHLTNLLMHAVSVVLFFYLLERMTGELWPSAICAALFAIHPLRVESVAWVAERRDVLAMLLLMVTLAAYLHYASRPSLGRYALVVLSFGLGLAAKQMLVTLPFALLLLDYWPLYRLRLGQAGSKSASAQVLQAVPVTRLILEKVPLLAMVLAVSLLTFHHVQQVGGISSQVLLKDRLAVSLAGYLGYLEKTFWPANLAALYPFRVPPWWHALFAAALLVAITAALIRVGRSKPMLLVGWLWFVGTLFPVSGIIQMGSQSMADRYSYLPHIGLLITVVWGVGGLTVWQNARSQVQTTLVALIVVALGMLTWFQVWCWQNTETLFRHSLSVTKNNYTFHSGLSGLLAGQGIYEEAEHHIRRALDIAPEMARLHGDCGALMVRREKFQEAVVHLETALRLGLAAAETHYSLGVALNRLGRTDEAKQQLVKSIESWDSARPPEFFGRGVSIVPDHKASPHLMLCEMALRDGHPEEALASVERALTIKPDLEHGFQFKGIALGRLNRWADATTALQTALNLAPQNAVTQGYLAFAYDRQGKKDLAYREYADLLSRFSFWAQTSSDFAIKRVTKTAFRDPRLAEEIALQICEATQYKEPRWLDTLAAAQAARGDFTQAQQTVHTALKLAPSAELTQRLQVKLRLYEGKRALPVE